MTHTVKHSCGGMIKQISENLWECEKCGEIKTGEEIAKDDKYGIVEV